MAEWLERLPLALNIPGSRFLMHGFYKITLSSVYPETYKSILLCPCVHPGMGTWLPSELGKNEGGEGEE